MGGGGLRAGVFDVVVVVVEFHVFGSGGVRCGEGNGDVCGTDGVVPYVGAVGAVIVEGLVDHVPGVAGASPVGDEVGDVVRHYRDEGCVVPSLGGEPVGELGVPY